MCGEVSNMSSSNWWWSDKWWNCCTFSRCSINLYQTAHSGQRNDPHFIENVQRSFDKGAPKVQLSIWSVHWLTSTYCTEREGAPYVSHGQTAKLVLVAPHRLPFGCMDKFSWCWLQVKRSRSAEEWGEIQYSIIKQLSYCELDNRINAPTHKDSYQAVSWRNIHKQKIHFKVITDCCCEF